VAAEISRDGQKVV